MMRAVPRSHEGRFAIVTDVESGMRWTLQVGAQSLRGRLILKRTAKPCGPGLPTLRLSQREMISLMTGARKPGPRGERDISRKTIAQGMPDDPAEPVVTAASFFCCWRAMGEALTRHSLRPLVYRGTQLMQNSGAIAPRERALTSYWLFDIRSQQQPPLSSRTSEARAAFKPLYASADPGPITTGSRRLEGRCNVYLA
jgi:hypothetical protein